MPQKIKMNRLKITLFLYEIVTNMTNSIDKFKPIPPEPLKADLFKSLISLNQNQWANISNS